MLKLCCMYRNEVSRRPSIPVCSSLDPDPGLTSFPMVVCCRNKPLPQGLRFSLSDERAILTNDDESLGDSCPFVPVPSPC